MMTSRVKATLMTATALVGGMIFVAPTAAMAQAAPAAKSNETRSYDISAQDLRAALQKYAEESGLQLVYDSKIALGKTSSAVSGSMSAQDALGALLAGSGLTATFSGNGTVIISTAGEAAIPSLGVVRVEGAGGNGQASAVNGINGSRDTEATEGTGSYTTGAVSIGTKDAQSIKETPASITVLTAQNIADQNITDLKGALDQMSGVTLTQSTVGNGDARRGAGFDQAQFYSRGFEITSIQIDGGAPITTGGTFLSGSNLYTPAIDLSEYDSIQLLRGADGLFNGYGDPGGTINLVRKKPLDHDQVTLDAQYGSYNDYRAVADLTGPIGFDGHLRARVVGTYEDTDYFYKVAHSTKNLFYGIVEADVTPTTLVDFGMDYTHQFGIPNAYGLPRSITGDSLNLPVATCLCFPWSHSDFKTTNFFVDVDQKIGKDWGLKVKATRLIQTVDSKYGFVSGAVNPVTGAGASATYARFAPRTHEWAVDATLNGAFMLFGQRQEILAGANYQYSDSGGTVGYNNISLGAVNVFTFNPNDPNNPLNNAPADRSKASYFNSFGSTQWGAYGNIRFTPFKGLHLISGIRYQKFNANFFIQNGICDTISTFCPTIGQISTIYTLFNIPSTVTGVNRSSNFQKPNISAIYDVTKNLSAYGTYARIYQPQVSEVTATGQTLPPVTGRNIEGGLKWQAPGGTMAAPWASPWTPVSDARAGTIVAHRAGRSFPSPRHDDRRAGMRRRDTRRPRLRRQPASGGTRLRVTRQLGGARYAIAAPRRRVLHPADDLPVQAVVEPGRDRCRYQPLDRHQRRRPADQRIRGLLPRLFAAIPSSIVARVRRGGRGRRQGIRPRLSGRPPGVPALYRGRQWRSAVHRCGS